MTNLNTCSFDGCERNRFGLKEVCNPHYQQTLTGKSLKPLRKSPPVIPLEVRFWSRVDKSGDCWEWTARKSSDGYGSFHVEGVPKRVHRISYLLTHGSVPPLIDHICGNTLCVNPGHLRPADFSQNSQNQTRLSRRNSTGYRGVTYDKSRDKYKAAVCDRGTRYELGRFDTAEEAAEVARLKRNELFTHNDRDRAA